MTKAGVLVMGPAGSGKSTFCNALLHTINSVGRVAHLVNLDPAAESFDYEPTIDIRELISVDDVMEELQLGPNGALIYCFEFLLQNLDWLDEALGDYDDDYLLFDLPGQIELYTHSPILPKLTAHLAQNNSFRLCVAYLLESQFIVDRSKFFAGTLSAMSAMLMLEVPHVNVMSKVDLIQEQYTKTEIKRFLRADPLLISEQLNKFSNVKFKNLNEALVKLISDFNMVSFLPLESSNEKSVKAILSYLDQATQWLEDQEPKEPDDANYANDASYATEA